MTAFLTTHDAQVRAWWDTVPRREIARRLDLHIGQVYRIARRLGLPRDTARYPGSYGRSPEMQERVRACARRGLTQTEMARELGVAVGTVVHHLRRMGYRRRIVWDPGMENPLRRCSICGGTEDVTKPHQHQGAA